MKKRIIISMFSSIMTLLIGCGKMDMVTDIEPAPTSTAEFITTEKLPTAAIEEPVTTTNPPTAPTVEPVATVAPYAFEVITGDFEDYNIIFQMNGYLYRFNIEMDFEDIEVVVETPVEEEKYGSKIMVSPVFVTNGDGKEQLGVMHGYQFEVRSDNWVQPYYFAGNKLCGKVVSVDENGIKIYLADEIDRDTYMEFVNISEEETYFEFSEDIEYVVHDINMRATEVTYERFKEHLSRNPNMVYYLFERDGKVVQLWEPYIP